MSTDTRAQRVRALLSELGYRSCWQFHKDVYGNFSLEGYVGPAGVLIVQEYVGPAGSEGVEVYAPIVSNNSMQDLLDEIRRRSGACTPTSPS